MIIFHHEDRSKIPRTEIPPAVFTWTAINRRNTGWSSVLEWNLRSWFDIQIHPENHRKTGHAVTNSTARWHTTPPNKIQKIKLTIGRKARPILRRLRSCRLCRTWRTRTNRPGRGCPRPGAPTRRRRRCRPRAESSPTPNGIYQLHNKNKLIIDSWHRNSFHGFLADSLGFFNHF